MFEFQQNVPGFIAAAGHTANARCLAKEEAKKRRCNFAKDKFSEIKGSAKQNLKDVS